MTAETIYLKDYQVPDFLIDHVDLTFQLEEGHTLVKSALQIHRHPNAPSAKDLVLKGELLELLSVTINGKALSKSHYEKTDKSLTIFSVPEQFNLEIEVKIKPEENTALSGLYKSSGNFCTQCEAQGFRRITYFLDRPDVMATYTTTIIADHKRYPKLLSNGNFEGMGVLPNGKHWMKWNDPFKKPCYLFALVAGDFDFVEDTFVTQSGKDITLQIYVEKGNLDKCKHAMQSVKNAMRWDEKSYGREYDLSIYMIVAVSDFNMGAMENKGLNIFNSKYVLAKPDTSTDLDFINVESVIGHEYFHNWSGNRVTCRDWFQLSLKEGLTIFRDQEFTEDMTSKTVSRTREVNYLRTSQFPEDEGPLAHPVRPDSYVEINNFYTATVYNKGAEVIRMLKTIVGADVFRQGMDRYFEKFDGQAVTIEDFVRTHEEVSGVDLKQFRLWYSQAGTPTLTIQEAYDKETKEYILKIKQTCPSTPDQDHKKPFHIPVKMGLIDASGQEIVDDILHVTQHENTFTFSNIVAKPIPSFLRNFSAPVKLKFDYAESDFIHLAMHDTDRFNRWEIMQQYAMRVILSLVKNLQNNLPLEVPKQFITCFTKAIEGLQDDKWFLAEMLTLPNDKTIGLQLDIIDVENIYKAREFLIQSIGKQLRNELLALYESNQTENTHEFSMDKVGQRFLRNVCLRYLAEANPELAYDQFKQALSHNMTDTTAALFCLSQVDNKYKEKAFSEFYAKWHHDPLVVDKWLSLQAQSTASSTLDAVKKLLHHAAFDIKNPNKVYALIAAFGHNSLIFHQKNGEGYRFLSECVTTLNGLNPQVAARMLKPLTEWRRYDTMRQQLMREQLALLQKNPELSRDVYELVTKSL